MVPLPDFITNANRELMLSAAFLTFLVGAIVAIDFERGTRRVVSGTFLDGKMNKICGRCKFSEVVACLHN